MPSILDIRRRIRSVRSTQQITRAMKMMAAARLRRAQDRVIGARPYARKLREVLANVSARARELRHPLLAEREEKRVLLMVVAGEKGLAGAFNANIQREVGRLLRQGRWSEVSLVTVGKKAVDFWKRRSIPVERAYPGIFSHLEYRHARELAELFTALFVDGKVDAVYVVYNEFKSIIQQLVRVERILPVERSQTALAEAPENSIDYLYEPAPGEILARLLPRYLEFVVFKILLESAAAEHGARITAMDAATRNAGDMIDSLTLTYNRARQARITKELIEIVSGAAALE
jgi:F-type H+-transporting ATPase subunit gamma